MENTPDAEKDPVARDMHRNSSDLLSLSYCCAGIISLAGDDLENNFFFLLLLLVITTGVLLGLDSDIDAAAKDDDDGFTFFFMKLIAPELRRLINSGGLIIHVTVK